MLTLQQKVIDSFKLIQDEICNALVEVTGQSFQEDVWDYHAGSGGGITRVLEGDIIEKGGVNFSSVEGGELSEKIAGRLEGGNDRQFFATGVSLVLHPKNPFVPTVHMNVRYLEHGKKRWFGGGIDLTPYYPFEEDIIQFHKTLKETCDKHNAQYYPKFKKWCDEYFFIKHRNEPRGVGGIFFDYLTENLEQVFAFTCEVARTFPKAYVPILEKRNKMHYSREHREFQFLRRGRYVEFNLIYDRGTVFGLETGGRTETVLISLPPLAAWPYNFTPDPGSQEARLFEILTPRNWAEQKTSG
ncbi:MAG: oxygen-dependent coproporphyrinogen oxidase [Candidatus Marinimicrobia bacterium]|nr:oxygen-dependent coproporphyrinogen oxidase [Candidatus Neomarinimicrobiota bacterium]